MSDFHGMISRECSRTGKNHCRPPVNHLQNLAIKVNRIVVVSNSPFQFSPWQTPITDHTSSHPPLLNSHPSSPPPTFQLPSLPPSLHMKARSRQLSIVSRIAKLPCSLFMPMLPFNPHKTKTISFLMCETREIVAVAFSHLSLSAAISFVARARAKRFDGVDRAFGMEAKRWVGLIGGDRGLLYVGWWL